ncbi:NUDIX domain-containing protein [Williamsia herbipolensis]|uniref:NUDIX domain-containing protein n=1 Tax=Williamsia herbipolensis TaxID=1603258 RepID=A0AAU4JYM8_9NOCA|nr:NUDIX domain-containing protein [Williamsia herbipolensis]
MTERLIVVSAVVIRDVEGRVLTVRKRGTSRFMLPGGKPEPGESAAQAAIREVHEEVGAVLDPAQLTSLGVHATPAANEDGYTLRASVFEHPWLDIPGAAAEIDEVRWLAPVEGDRPDIAPLLTQAVFPLLSRGA